MCVSFTRRRIDLASSNQEGLRQEQGDLHLLAFCLLQILASGAFVWVPRILFLQKQFLKCGYFTFDLVQKQEGQASCALWQPWKRPGIEQARESNH